MRKNILILSKNYQKSEEMYKKVKHMVRFEDYISFFDHSLMIFLDDYRLVFSTYSFYNHKLALEEWYDIIDDEGITHMLDHKYLLC